MPLFEDEPKKPKPAYVLGQDVSALSATELTDRIGELTQEIARLEGERVARGATKTAAEALFRR